MECYSVAICSNAIAPRRQNSKFDTGLAAPVALLCELQAAKFSIAAGFSSRGGDGLKRHSFFILLSFSSTTIIERWALGAKQTVRFVFMQPNASTSKR